MKTALIWAAEIAVAALAMWIDMRLFWLYFFVIVVWLVNRRVDYLRKVVRTFQIANEMKLLAIASRVGVEQADIARQYEVMWEELSAEQRSALEKDLGEVFKEANR